MNTVKTIRIALIGKIGHGKSSTGNTILRRNAFEVSSTKTGTIILDLKNEYINGYFLKVFDTPGNMTLDLSKEKIRREMYRMMEAAKEIDVFILVYSFHARFTGEEKQAIIELENIFGKTFLEEHGMVVITHKDRFDQVFPEVSFERWCEMCTPEFRELKEKVKNRMFLVENKGDFIPGSKRMTSSEQMFKMFTELQTNKASYKKEDLNSCSIF